jgi:dTDP-4-amino-4,6-dideoxygalactose transaminase
MEKVWLSSPHMSGAESKYVAEAFETNWISPVGPHIQRFESALSTYNNVPYCAALSSGTAAIHLALIILGVKSGDEVICSTFTFSGSCNPIVYQNATPVFVDSERDTFNLDPRLLEDAILDRERQVGKLPKAIIAVHLYGMPAKIDEIMAVAGKYGIPVIEDAAEALGSTWKGKKIGSFGDFGVFSFNGNKIITTSGGGALVSSNEKWIEKAKFLATQARDPAPYYQHSQIGYNYRLSNVCAAIGLGQMEVLDKRVAERRAVFEFYRSNFQDLFDFTIEPKDGFSNRWLTTITSRNGGPATDEIRLHLEKFNIESRPLWKPMHLQPIFANCPAYLNGVSEQLFSKGLCLPSGSNLSQMQLQRVVGLIKELR